MLTHHITLLHILAVQLPNALLQLPGVLDEADTVMQVCFEPVDQGLHILPLCDKVKPIYPITTNIAEMKYHVL